MKEKETQTFIAEEFLKDGNSIIAAFDQFSFKKVVLKAWL